MLLLGAVLIASVLAYFLVRNHRLLYMAFKIPSPTSVPLVGDLLLLYRHNFNIVKALDLINKPYGDCYKVWARVPLVFVWRPKDMEIVCSSPALQDRGHVFDGVHEFMGDDTVLTCRAERSREFKKLFHKTFTNSSQTILFENFHKAVEDLMNTFKLREGQWFDSLRFLKEATSTAIIGNALSVNIKDHKKLAEGILDNFSKYVKLLTNRGVSPLHRNDFLYHHVFGGKEFCKIKNSVLSLLNDEIKSKQDDLSEMKAIEVPNQYIFNVLREKPQATMQNDFANDCIALVLAALDTSAATAAFTLLMLSMHPEVQQLAYEEDKAIQEEFNGKLLDERSVVKYEFLSRIIKETMRMFPPIPIIPRRVNEDTNFGKFVVPKGSSIMASILSLHRDATIYEKPNVFDPDRFLPDNIKKIPKYCYLPFGGGLRSCPGYRYGTQSAIYTVSSIIRNYKVYTTFKSIEEIDRNLEMVVSLNIVGGFPLRLESRV